MKADKELLLAMADKLIEIAETCTDADAKENLNEFITAILTTVEAI